MKKIILIAVLCVYAPQIICSQKSGQGFEGQSIYCMPQCVISKVGDEGTTYDSNKFSIFAIHNKAKYYGQLESELARTVPIFTSSIEQNKGKFTLGSVVQREDLSRFISYVQIRFDLTNGVTNAQQGLHDFVKSLQPQEKCTLQAMVKNAYKEEYSKGLLDLPLSELSTWGNNKNRNQQLFSIKCENKFFQLSVNDAKQIPKFSENIFAGGYLEVDCSSEEIFLLLGNYLKINLEEKNCKKADLFIEDLPSAEAEQLEEPLRKLYCGQNLPGFDKGFFATVQCEASAFYRAMVKRNMQDMKRIILRNGKLLGGSVIAAAFLLIYAKYKK